MAIKSLLIIKQLPDDLSNDAESVPSETEY
jgi:hypothetical protein